jgi:hypothetical protein
MSTDPLANLQPDNGGGTPSEPPTPPVVDPVTPPANDASNQMSEADKADAAEWDKAADDIFPGIHDDDKDKGKRDDEHADESKTTQTTEAPKTGQDGKEPPKPGDKKPDENGEGEDSENEPTEPSDATSRLTAREQQEQVDAVKSDVREKMFKDVPTELRAGDGELLDTVEKVMQYKKPGSDETFTRDEATLWLAQAERALDKNVADMNRQIDQITDTNLNLKDQADVINYQYGELLRAMPDLRAKLWSEYEKTLDKDSKSGIITKAKVSLKSFYEAALEPYAQLGRRLENEQGAKVVEDTAAADKAKKEAEATKAQRRADRSDIYAAGKTDTTSDEDKEWAAAAEAVFGPLNK